LFGLVGGLLFGGCSSRQKHFNGPPDLHPPRRWSGCSDPPLTSGISCFFLGGLIAIWLALFVAIVIHELGHFIVGRMVGFSLQSPQLGRISIAFEYGKLI
jgi:hypothetical protein